MLVCVPLLYLRQCLLAYTPRCRQIRQHLRLSLSHHQRLAQTRPTLAKAEPFIDVVFTCFPLLWCSSFTRCQVFLESRSITNVQWQALLAPVDQLASNSAAGNLKFESPSSCTPSPTFVLNHPVEVLLGALLEGGCSSKAGNPFFRGRKM